MRCCQGVRHFKSIFTVPVFFFFEVPVSLFTARLNILQLYFLSTRVQFCFSMVHRTSSDNFPVHHWPTGLYSWEWKCLLPLTSCILTCIIQVTLGGVCTTVLGCFFAVSRLRKMGFGLRWWTNWHCNRFSPSTSVSPVYIWVILPVLHTHRHLHCGSLTRGPPGDVIEAATATFVNSVQNICGFRVPPGCKWDIRFCWILCSIDW